MKYDAFISYSHAADGRLAPALQKGLRRLAKPLLRIRALHVFRDKTSLSASPALWPAIERALSVSSYFVLLASPDAARSKWVEREVAWWLDHRPADRLLIVLTSGELVWDAGTSRFDAARTTALPALLLERLQQEPLWIDMRWANTVDSLSLRHQQFRGAVLDIAATLHERAKEELDGEDVRQYRILRTIAAVFVSLIVAFAVAAEWQRRVANAQRNIADEQRGIAETQRDLAGTREAEAVAARGIAEQNERQANEQRLLAEERYRQALAGRLSIQSQTIRSDYPDQLPLSALLAVEAMNNHASSVEAVQALRNSLVLLPRLHWNSLHPSQRIVAIRFSPDGRRLVTTDGIWDASNGRRIAGFDHDGRSNVFAMSADGRRIVRAARTPDAQVFDAGTGGAALRSMRNGRAITTVALNPDGRLLAVGCEDHIVRVWEVASGTMVQQLEMPDRTLSGAITKVGFSPDGRYLAASRRTEIHVWDVAAWHSAGSLQTDAVVTNFEFTPDGSRILAANLSRARLFELSGKRLSAYEFDADVGPAAQIALSPDGHYAGVAGRMAIVWEVANQRLVTKAASSGALAFSPDAASVAVGGGNITRVIDLSTGGELARMSHDGTVRAVAFHPNNASLVTAADDGRLRLWSASAAAHVARIQGTFSRVRGGQVITVSEGNGLSAWDSRSRGRARIVPDGSPRAPTWAAGGTRVATSRGEIASVWHVTGGAAVAELLHAPALDWEAIRQREEGERKRSYRAVGPEIERMQSDGSVAALELSPDGRYLLTTRADEIARVWDVNLGREATRIPYRERIVAAFSADSRYMATASPGEPVRVWDLRTLRPVEIPAPARAVDKLVLGPSGSHVAVMAAFDVTIWRVAERTVAAAMSDVRATDVSSDGTFLLTDEVNAARLWNLDTGRQAAAITCTCRIKEIRFSPDARYFLAVGDAETYLRRVGVPGAAGLMTLDGDLLDFAFSQDGTLLAALERRLTLVETEDTVGRPGPSGTESSFLRVWNLRDRKELFTAQAAGAPSFSAGGRFVGAGSAVWDVATGEEIARVPDTIVGFSPDARYLITRAPGWTDVWLWQPADLLAAACETLRATPLIQQWTDFVREIPYPQSCGR